MCITFCPCRLPNAFVADPPLEQVITKGVEFGAKGKIDNHYWEATYFHFINFDDIQFVGTAQVSHLVTLKTLEKTEEE